MLWLFIWVSRFLLPVCCGCLGRSRDVIVLFYFDRSDGGLCCRARDVSRCRMVRAGCVGLVWWLGDAWVLVAFCGYLLLIAVVFSLGGWRAIVCWREFEAAYF